MNPIIQAKTLFVIAVSTARMIFPGIPSVTPEAGVKKLPPPPASLSVNMELYGTAKAGPNAFAIVRIPSGLRSGNEIKMEIERKSAPVAKAKPAEVSKIVEKTYWGCGKQIGEGQPFIAPNKKPAAKVEVSKQPVISAIPSGSYAFWPTEKTHQPQGKINAQGNYSLFTSYAGNTVITLDSEQNGLPAIDVSDISSNPDFNKPITITWKMVPNAKAYFLTAFGGNDNESINWSSSEKPGINLDFTVTALSLEQLKKYLDDNVLLPANATSCTIPAEVFKGSTGAMVDVIAIGKDNTQIEDNIETRVIVRSTANISLFKME